MPYQVYEEEGRFCVHKKNADDSKGARVPGGCHPTHAEAEDHMKALYANVEDASKSLPMFGATSFDELDEEFEQQNKEMAISDLIGRFDLLLKNIMASDDPDKASKIEALSREFAGRVVLVSGSDAKDRSWVSDAVESLKKAFGMQKGDEDQPLMIWKEADGSYMWLIRYSNHFEDEDNPPDIISSDSHRKFVEKVDKGLAPYPELLLWHVPQWKIGKATAVAYDESGFAVAMGKFDKGLDSVAEWLDKQKDSFAASHGMPVSTVVRDESDPSVIVEHETREISLLPRWAAANKRTSLVVLGTKQNKEDDMSIPVKKKEELISRGISPDVLEKLEMMNEADARSATEAGIKSKEAGVAEEETNDSPEVETEAPGGDEEPTEEEDASESESVSEEPVSEEPASEEPVSEEASPADLPPTRAEVADAVANVINPILNELSDSLAALGKEMRDSVSTLSKEIEALKASDEEKIEKSLMSTPSASIAALVAQRINKSSTRSPLGANDPLKESKPTEAEAEESPSRVIGIPFLDKMRVDEPDHVGRVIRK